MNRRPKQIVWVVILAMLAVALIFSSGWARGAAAQDQQDPGEMNSASYELLSESEYVCTINNITAYTSRIHVRCIAAPPGFSGVVYFASSNDAANIRVTNQFLLLLNTAYAMNKQVGVRFDTSTAANPPGCLAHDCRKLIGIYTLP